MNMNNLAQSIAVPNETLEILMDNKVTIEFKGFSIYDFWSVISCTKEIIDIIIKERLQWRYNHFPL